MNDTQKAHGVRLIADFVTLDPTMERLIIGESLLENLRSEPGSFVDNFLEALKDGPYRDQIDALTAVAEAEMGQAA